MRYAFQFTSEEKYIMAVAWKFLTIALLSLDLGNFKCDARKCFCFVNKNFYRIYGGLGFGNREQTTNFVNFKLNAKKRMRCQLQSTVKFENMSVLIYKENWLKLFDKTFTRSITIADFSDKNYLF